MAVFNKWGKGGRIDKEMGGEIRKLVYQLQCQYCLYCDGDRECRLDPNYGEGRTKLIEDCGQSTFAGEDS